MRATRTAPVRDAGIRNGLGTLLRCAVRNAAMNRRISATTSADINARITAPARRTLAFSIDSERNKEFMRNKILRYLYIPISTIRAEVHDERESLQQDFSIYPLSLTTSNSMN